MTDPIVFDPLHDLPWPVAPDEGHDLGLQFEQISSHVHGNPPSLPKATGVQLHSMLNEYYDPILYQDDNSYDQESGHGFESQLTTEEIANPLKRRIDNEKDNLCDPEEANIRSRRSNSEPPPRKIRSRNPRQRISEEEWNKRRPLIESLYTQQNKELELVMAIMLDEYSFKASRTAYIEHLKVWNAKQKNICRDLKVLMWQKMVVRKEEGKETRFRHQGTLVPMRKITRGSSTYSTLDPVISTPLSLSILTPSDTSQTRSVMSIRPLEQSQSTAINGNAQEVRLMNRRDRRSTSVVINQQIENQAEPALVTGPMCIEERLEVHSWNHQKLFDELSGMPAIGPLLDLLQNCKFPQSNELLLEIILSKTEELPAAEKISSLKTREYAISLARSLVLQSKYWQAGLILKGMCESADMLSLRGDHRIEISKLRLLVDIGANIEEPRLVANVEGKCKMLLAEETLDDEGADGSEREGSSSLNCYCAGNLISAYLLRLYGIKCRDLDPYVVSKVSLRLRKQLSYEEPPLSAVWAAQQHIRFCLRKGQLHEVKKFFDLSWRALVAIGRKHSPEADLNIHLTEVLRSHSRTRTEPLTPPEIVDVYYKQPVDIRWLEAFKSYVHDRPHACPDEIKRSKHSDAGYWS